MRRFRLGWAIAIAAWAAPAAAERLAIRAFTSAEGLAHDHVHCLVPDSRGFLWLCTAQGLSRFDGRRFVTYGAAHGLREAYVNDALETRAGELWVATNGAGASRLDVDTGRFVEHSIGASTASNRVNTVLEGDDGRLWAGTDDGLFVRDREGAFHSVDVPGPRPLPVRSLAREGGAILVATRHGLFRIDPSGAIARVPGPAGSANTHCVLADGEGRLWTGQEKGLRVYDAASGAPDPSVPEQDRFGDGIVRVLFRRADGRVLAGGHSDGGLHEWTGGRLRTYTAAHGLSDEVVTALAEDRSGSLWIGTETRGVMRLAAGGFASFGAADGLGHRRVVSMFETAARELVVLTSMRYLNRLERGPAGDRFAAVRPGLPVPPSILSVHSAIQDRTEGWWVATPQGLARYGTAPGLDALARARPLALYTARDGLAGDDVGRPYEDARGDVWVTTSGATVSRWDRARGTFHRYGVAEGLPAGNAPMAFGEDAAGTLWVGLREGGVARLAGERFEAFGAAAGFGHAMTRSLHRDGRGRLWAATTGDGLVRIDASSATPRFRRYTTADGLPTDHIRCLTDDAQGVLYLGTALGVVRFDPDGGAVTRYTTADGLAQNEIQAAYRDRSGGLWFGTMDGVSRLVLPPARVEPTPPALVASVAVGGTPRPIGALGLRDVPAFAVGPGAGGVRIDYFTADLSPEARGSFEYRLRGADDAWSAPTTRDFVEYPALSPGRYRFEVRAAGADPGQPPASVAFVVQPPLWRRGWFLALAGGAVGVGALRLHRLRVRRLVELERVRTRIATDLHDDVGSSLSQIAIWSEVAARDSGEPGIREALGGIASACRETVDSMGDIVWAINPSHDRLGDLVHRMRRFANDVLSARDVAFRFDAALPDEVALGADLRRQVLLVFKEAVNNAVRHAGAARAEASVTLSGGRLHVIVRDDGCGFDPSQRGNGHGLASMAARAAALGGSLEIRSAAGQGTTVSLDVPVARPHLRR